MVLCLVRAQPQLPGAHHAAPPLQAARGLIVIWGGSEVDHDTTIHYRQSGDLVLTMNHRGLSGILPRLTAQLQKR